MTSVTVAVVQTGSILFGTPATLAEAGHCAHPDAFALSVDRAARPRGRPAT
jgi:hypothetical protein